MKKTLLLVLVNLVCLIAYSQRSDKTTLTQTNKEIALRFYQDLWFTNNTDNYAQYVADSYIVHDIGDRKGVIEQKNIADFFWENGALNCKMDYQIAEGDLVATRWIADYEPRTLLGKIAIGQAEIPIINVFRIQGGKIVEFWNHRHDIDTPQTLKYTIRGLFFGLLVALIPTFFVFRLKRKLRRTASYRNSVSE